MPITGPQFQSALNASSRYLQVLGSPTCPCKFLKTLVIHTLKRLASAVQLRPWPPYFQSLSTNPHGVETRSERGFCDHSVTKQKNQSQGRSGECSPQTSVRRLPHTFPAAYHRIRRTEDFPPFQKIPGATSGAWSNDVIHRRRNVIHRRIRRKHLYRNRFQD